MDLKKKFDDVAQPLKGKTVAFTGELAGVTRRQASAIVRELGAKVSKTVTASTDFVVAGKVKNTSRKLKDAVNKGVSVVYEQDFFAKVREQRAANKAAKSQGPQ